MVQDPNKKRADLAENAVNAFADSLYGRSFTVMIKAEPNGDENSDAYVLLNDLITDCLHLAARQGWDPESIANKALECYHVDVANERNAEDQNSINIKAAAVG